MLAATACVACATTPSAAALEAPTAPAQTPSASTLPSGPSAVGEWVAKIVYRTTPRDAPSADARTLPVLRPVSQWGTPVELLVLDARREAQGPEWLRVLLDDRPNGTAVWVNSEDTVLHLDRWRIVVSRRRRRLRVYRDGHLKRVFGVVVGKPSTPTPGGLFAIAAELRQPNPEEFEGSWVLPLTAHSNVLQQFAGGDGQVALHGRGGASLLDPLGSARSHGCIRLANAAIDWIAEHVPAGTEVQVR